MTDMRHIPLTQGKSALVDDDDFDLVSSKKWYAHKQKSTKGTIYAVRTEGRKLIYMHRLILSTPKGKETDHINGDGLDNRRSNLRICSISENRRNRGMSKNNTSGFKGVSWHKYSKKWRATVFNNGKQIHIGSFKEKDRAVIAFKHACINLHGDFAKYDE